MVLPAEKLSQKSRPKGNNLIDHFSGTPRGQQAAVLEELQRSWASHDVFVVKAPVAFGKTKIAEALRSWTGHCTTNVPTNILQQQHLESDPTETTLWRMSNYDCKRYESNCADVKRIAKYHCKGCIYRQACSDARKSPTGIYNYYTMMVHKLFRKTAIFDEAHQLVPMLQDLAATNIWWHEYKYPRTVQTLSDILKWLEGIENKDDKLNDLLQVIKQVKETSMVHQTQDLYRGESRPVLKIIPLDTADAPPVLWPPKKVNKIVLLSATIGETDVQSMGLANRRVLTIDCESPIPPANRPVYAEALTNMSMKYQATSIPVVVRRLEELATQFKGQKGIIHAPYSVAERIRTLWQNPRVLYHTRGNKQEVYNRFRDSTMADGCILVASGLYEGIDLSYDLGRWQAITKIPYPYLGDPGIQAKQAKDPKWFVWETLKVVLQASGRICRSPDDYGATFILDSSFAKLYGEAESMAPGWFRQALVKKGW